MRSYDALPRVMRDMLKYEPIGADIANVMKAYRNCRQSGLSEAQSAAFIEKVIWDHLVNLRSPEQ